MAHGGWKSTAHYRYARFSQADVCSLAARMLNAESPYEDADARPRRVARDGELARGVAAADPLPNDDTNPYAASSDEEVEESPDRVLRSAAARSDAAAAAAAVPLSDDDDEDVINASTPPPVHVEVGGAADVARVAVEAGPSGPRLSTLPEAVVPVAALVPHSIRLGAATDAVAAGVSAAGVLWQGAWSPPSRRTRAAGAPSETSA